MDSRLTKTLAGLAAIAGMAAGGAAIGNAASSKSAATTTTTTTAAATPSFPAHGSAAHESAEKPVTGDAATKAQAAAVKYVGGGTAGAVTTDYPGTGYEVTVTKSDGTTVEVHLDGSFNVAQGGPGGHGVGGPAHGTPAHENAEKPVTGDAATKAQAAAVKSVGSGTAGAVTTDFFGDGYEVTVTKSDGSTVEVHLDSSFNVVQGGPGGPGGPHGFREHGPRGFGGFPGGGSAGSPGSAGTF
jgi:hypothetical protein